MIAEVLVNIPTSSIDKTFNYVIPEQLNYIDVGWRVVVPFGPQKLEGFVMNIIEGDISNLKPILDVLDDSAWFDKNMLTTAKWLSEYYLCTLNTAMRLFIPGKTGIKSIKSYRITDDIEYETVLASLKNSEHYQVFLYLIENGQTSITKLEKKFGKVITTIQYLLRKKLISTEVSFRERVKPRFQKIIKLIISPEQVEMMLDSFKKKPAQLRTLQCLLIHKQISYTDLKKFNISYDTVTKLKDAGILNIEQIKIMRDSYTDICQLNNKVELTTEQQQALQAINTAISEQKYQPFLLHGITGSGKTQVYIEAVAKIRAKGRQAIVLVPEIALTGQIVTRFKERFGNDVVVIHSKLSAGERYDAWQRLHNNDAGIVIGARSAIFAPLNDIGIIIMDEEHEFTYKQEETPRYHARQVALFRASLTNAVVILGSATPSIETYYNALQGNYTLLKITKRVDNAMLPKVEIVDMREELAKGRRSVISLSLQKLLNNAIERKEQAIILLNRRGYSTFVLCRECGHVLRCKYCDISMVYHSIGNKLSCHYCNNTEHVPNVCPNCGSRYIRYFGTGTQKLEAELGKLFPAARIVRMDQDTTSTKMAYDRILKDFANNKYDILLGTQVVAKGHDISNVTAVGIVAADSILNLPDFRAAERVFALITQAAGRAGRGEKQGNVVIQTYNPEHYAVLAGAKQDYLYFYKQEITYRQALIYPPYTQMIKLTTHGKIETEVNAQANNIAINLKQILNNDKATEIIGPFNAPIAKINNIYRVSILIKSKNINNVKQAISSLDLITHQNVIIDVEPISII